MKRRKNDVIKGTLDMLILKTLQVEELHGWGIAKRIQQSSGDVLHINQGSLYPALYRLEHKGLIASEWGASENNRRAKYYRLTKAGERRLRKEEKDWRRTVSAIATVLEAT